MHTATSPLRLADLELTHDVRGGASFAVATGTRPARSGDDDPNGSIIIIGRGGP